jgi:hypothetical protein
MQHRVKVPDRPSWPRWSRSAWLLMCSAAGIGTITVALQFRHGIDVVLALAVLICAAAPTLARLSRHEFDILEPNFGTAVVLALLFGIRPLYIIANGQYEYLGYNTEPQLTAVIGLGLVGTVSFMVGYGAFRRQRFDEAKPPPTVNELDRSAALRRSVTGVAILASALGMILFALNLLRMGPLTRVIPLWLGGQSSALASGNVGTSE